MSKERSIQTMSLDGNCLCFNFINTVHSRRDENGESFEYLSSYEKLVEWCGRLEVLTESRRKKLAKDAASHPVESQKALEEILNAREMLYRFFSPIAAGQPVKEPELEALNHYLSRTLSKLKFAGEGKKLYLDWEVADRDFREPLWRVVKSVYDIITGENFDRIKECEACGWIFLDKSKNKSRRWCSMQTCGSIHKAKKYYYRSKKEAQK